MAGRSKASSIDECIAGFPPETQARLQPLPLDAVRRVAEIISKTSGGGAD